MGKSILELFQTAKKGEINILPGIPLEVKGETPKERYDIRNSKDIRVSSSSPLLKLSFGALNAIRRGVGARKSESFLEEEFSGNRILRTLSLPIIYGTDIIRLTTESTSVVEKMKNSANGGEGSGFSKFGQKIQATRDKIANSKVLGLPKPLNPTEYYTQFNEKLNPVYDRMIKINEIKQNAAGSELGKILKNSAGGASSVGKQVLGGALSSAKKQLKNKILGAKGQSQNGNNDFSRLDDEGEPFILYSQEFGENYSGVRDGVKFGKANPSVDDANLKYNIKDKYNRRVSGNDLFPNITNNGQDFHSKTQYSARLDNFDVDGKNGNKELNKYNLTNKFSRKSSYTNISEQSISGKASRRQDLRYLEGRSNGVQNFDWRQDNLVYIRASEDKSGQRQNLYFGTLREQYFFLTKTFNFPYQENTGQIYGKGIEYLENGPYVIGKSETVIDAKDATLAYGFRQYYYPDIPRTRNRGTFPFRRAAKQLDPAEPGENGQQKTGLGADKVFPTITGKLGTIGIDLNKLRPAPLNYKDINNKPSYSKRKSDFYNTETNATSLYGLLDDTLEKRGFGTNRDVINQTGRIPQNKLNSIKVGNKSLKDVDLIPLRFQRVNDGVTIYMRAAVTSYQETFTPGWDAKQMLGNPFKFYTYTGIERKVGFTIKAYALSQAELITMWSKLDFLAHLAYPFSFSSEGVSPTLLYFTLGNLFLNKPAIITTLTFNVDDNQQLWEIGGTTAKIRKDNYENIFNNKFLIKNNETLEVGSESKLYKSPQNKYEYVEQDKDNIALQNDLERNFLLDEKTINSTNRTNISNIEYNEVKIGGKNVNMDNYKVPKVISIQIELTFLETAGTTSGNLYATGTPIDNGVIFKPSNKPKPNKETKKEYKEDKRTIRQTYEQNPEWIPGGGVG